MCAMAGALVLAFSTRGVPAALLGGGPRQRLAGVPGAGGGGGRLCAMAGALMRITRSGPIGKGLLSPPSSGTCRPATRSEVG